MRFVGFDRDEALLTEKLAGLALEPGHLMTHGGLMLVHALEPIVEPAQPRFEKRHAQSWMPLEHTARDDVEAGGHLLERMADHVHEENVLRSARWRSAYLRAP